SSTLARNNSSGTKPASLASSLSFTNRSSESGMLMVVISVPPLLSLANHLIEVQNQVRHHRPRRQFARTELRVGLRLADGNQLPRRLLILPVLGQVIVVDGGQFGQLDRVG